MEREGLMHVRADGSLRVRGCRATKMGGQKSRKTRGIE